MPHTYFLRCSDGSYHAGSTQHLEARLSQHSSPEQGAVHTRRRRPVVLVRSAWFASVTEAFALEKQVQDWGRAKREALVDGDWDALPGLSRRLAVQLRAQRRA